jgi:hypothetical protein
MANEESSMNPYAAPATLPLALGAPISRIRSVVLIYRCVGALGLAACGVAFYDCFAIGDKPREYVLLALILAHAGVFALTLHVAHRLARNPNQARKSARWIGFAIALLYCPVLTIPGLYAVWKVDKFFGSQPPSEQHKHEDAD